MDRWMPLESLAPLVEPLKARTFRLSDLDEPTPDESLVRYVWTTWLRWIPGPQQEPFAPYTGWELNRHGSESWAVVRFDGSQDTQELEKICSIPRIMDAFDAFPDCLNIVGFTNQWHHWFRAGAHFDWAQNWADAVCCILHSWSVTLTTDCLRFVPTITRIDHHPCVLLV